MQRFKCGLCNNDHSFNQQGHCERHITTQHSGFGWKCTVCGNVLGRKGQKHGCEDARYNLVKRSTMTLTPDEADEFAKFQLDKAQYVRPCMEKVAVPFSDQPYKNGKANKRRAQLTEAPAMKKVKKAAEKTAAPYVRDPVKKTEEHSDSVNNTCRDPVKKTEERSDSVNNTCSANKITTAAVVHVPVDAKPKTPVTPSMSPPSAKFRDLFGSDISDSESEKEEDESMESPDISISEPPNASTPKRTVTVELERKYVTYEKGTQTVTMKEDIGPLNKFALDQKDRIILNVGGKSFTTTRNTLRRAPDSLLAKMLNSHVKPYREKNGVPEYFLDRDATHFALMLHYLRDGQLGVSCHLPTEVKILRQIHLEAVYYGLDDFATLLVNGFCRVMFGEAPQKLKDEE